MTKEMSNSSPSPSQTSPVPSNQINQGDEGYRRFFAQNPLPMWIYDLETLAFLAVNEAAVEHYGYTRKEFLAMTIAEIRPAEDIPTLLELSVVAEGVETPLQLEFLRTNSCDFAQGFLFGRPMPPEQLTEL